MIVTKAGNTLLVESEKGYLRIDRLSDKSFIFETGRFLGRPEFHRAEVGYLAIPDITGFLLAPPAKMACKE